MLTFLLDFDGTVAPQDTVDALLQTFASPEWIAIEAEWVAGRINSQECMAAQLALVRATRGELDAFFDTTALDPWFSAFIRYVRDFADIAIVSDGIDYSVMRSLARAKIDLPVYANRAELRDGHLNLSFPHAKADCEVQSGVCKCAVAREISLRGDTFTVLVGDGRSDFCFAARADYVFAKRSLRTHCEQNNIPFTPFETFEDVLTVIKAARDEAQSRRMTEASCQFATRYRAYAMLQ